MVSVLVAGVAFLRSSQETGPQDNGQSAGIEPSQASVPPGELHLRLLPSDGRDVKDCQANLWVRSDRGLKMNAQDRPACVQGAVHMEGLAPGPYRLQVQIRGMELYEHDFNLGPDHGLDLGSVEVGPGGIITGVVTFEGAPAEGAFVRVQGKEEQIPVMPEGRFRLAGAPVGPMVLEAATATALYGKTQVQVVEDHPAEIEIALSPLKGSGVLGVRLVSDTGAHRIDAIHPQSNAAGRLSVGEVIVAVDGTSVVEMDKPQVSAMLSGEPGTSVNITLQDGREVSVERVPQGRLQ